MAYDDTHGYSDHTDVEALVQMGEYDGTTIPTLQQVYDFQAARAGEIYAVLYGVMGDSAPGPSGYSTSIDNSTDRGYALEAALKKTNAYGAAVDALEAAGAGEVPARSERAAEFHALYKDGLERVRMLALMYQGDSSRSATHISEGEITVADVTSREEDGYTFRGDQEW